MSERIGRRFSLGVGLLASLLASACSSPPQQPAAAAKVAAATDRDAIDPLPDLGASDPACRDWSTLDPATLPPLPTGKHVPLFDAVWRRVIEKHFDPTLGCVDWSAHRMGYGRAVAEAATDAEAYAQIDALLDQLGHSHVRLFPPVREQAAMGPASPPVTVRWIDDALVVVDATPETLRGATLHTIDGLPTEPWLTSLRAEHDADALADVVARRAAARLSCPREGMTHTLGLIEARAPDTELQHITVTCAVPPGERVTLGNLRHVPTRVDHRMLDSTVGVLEFNVWMLPMLPRVREALADLRARGMKALIIDLRGNPGGVGAMVIPLARLLLSEPTSLGSMRFRKFEQHLRVEPDPEQTPFAGPVVVLIDEGTASTSEIFVLGLRELGRIAVVGGHRSAGAALPSVIEEMPGRALLQLVVADYRSAKGERVEGKGIEPDVWVEETAEAIADKGDPVLAAGHEHALRLL